MDENQLEKIGKELAQPEDDEEKKKLTAEELANIEGKSVMTDINLTEDQIKYI